MAKDPSRTEKPTQKRLNDARKDGSVPKSQDLGKVATLIIGVTILRMLIGWIADNVRETWIWLFSHGPAMELTPRAVYELFLMLSTVLAKILLPILLCLAVAAFIIMRIQVGHLWTTKPMKPKFGKMFNIVAGLQKLMISPEAGVRLLKSLLQAFFVAIIPYIMLKREMQDLLPLFFQTSEGVAVYILTMAFKLVVWTLLPMSVIAAADLVYTRWSYTENLKMTKQEVKDERRQIEGDPQVKNQQRQKMFEVMGKRMLEAVPKADVVITNPTHFAVALSYDPLKAPAPVVLAKGADHMAQRIKELARENSVPIRENKPLARALYDQVEIGEMIPEELYQAVASLLAQLGKFGRRSQ